MSKDWRLGGLWPLKKKAPEACAAVARARSTGQLGSSRGSHRSIVRATLTALVRETLPPVGCAKQRSLTSISMENIW